ncbi:coiled-coil domain-containing protein 187 isoform 9-T9 [Syngnathus typhle]
MAELQIDQSNLPRVQEVCQSFAVLEDGVLAHNLQEQEIEQYYSNNVQKNQLVQNDIRVAKRLQDEEEERRRRALLRQESRQLEEEDDDFEYARLIQEEIRRRAQEVRRRERDDQEMAEQMQEEEELMMRRAREEEHHRGASLPPKKKQSSLDLGDLQQVLHDEELARKLHEQENNLLAGTSRRPPCGRYPEGDFRVAQVAQDEEIAHYMQKQEMESNRISRQLEEPHRHDRRTAPDRQVESEEGLPTPVEDRSLASPVSTLRQSPPVQNIAEELDPTFRAKRQGADILQTEQSAGSARQRLPGPRRLLEEPAFIPPTKRQKDKAKEKKEKCKQQ